jgi:hypothetical protein
MAPSRRVQVQVGGCKSIALSARSGLEAQRAVEMWSPGWRKRVRERPEPWVGHPPPGSRPEGPPDAKRCGPYRPGDLFVRTQGSGRSKTSASTLGSTSFRPSGPPDRLLTSGTAKAAIYAANGIGAGARPSNQGGPVEAHHSPKVTPAKAGAQSPVRFRFRKNRRSRIEPGRAIRKENRRCHRHHRLFERSAGHAGGKSAIPAENQVVARAERDFGTDDRLCQPHNSLFV